MLLNHKNCPTVIGMSKKVTVCIRNGLDDVHEL